MLPCALAMPAWGLQVVTVLEDLSNRRAVGKSRADYMDQVRLSHSCVTCLAGGPASLDVGSVGSV